MCCKDCGGKMTAFADSYGGAYEGCENSYGTGSHESYRAGQRKADTALLEACRRFMLPGRLVPRRSTLLARLNKRLEEK